jgi:hypothetical protein
MFLLQLSEIGCTMPQIRFNSTEISLLRTPHTFTSLFTSTLLNIFLSVFCAFFLECRLYVCMYVCMYVRTYVCMYYVRMGVTFASA